MEEGLSAFAHALEVVRVECDASLAHANAV
jgi:hypothetical protein